MTWIFSQSYNHTDFFDHLFTPAVAWAILQNIVYSFFVCPSIRFFLVNFLIFCFVQKFGMLLETHMNICVRVPDFDNIFFAQKMWNMSHKRTKIGFFRIYWKVWLLLFFSLVYNGSLNHLQCSCSYTNAIFGKNLVPEIWAKTRARKDHWYIFHPHHFIWLLHYITMSSCHGSMLLTLVSVGKDGGLITLCHSFGFDYQQRVLFLKRFLALAISAPRMI